jgi:hypothetical protein
MKSVTAPSGSTNPGADAAYVRTRTALHRVAAHVLSRRRFDACGRFGLRAGPGGFATPSFEDAHHASISDPAVPPEGPETIRVDGLQLIREVGARVKVMGLDGATLRVLARFVSADIDAPFECGAQAPPVGDPDEPLELDAGSARKLAGWYEMGWGVLDELFASLPADAAPATVQLWPEHFDVGTDVGLPGGRRINLGFSPGDAYEPGPYLYVGPRGPERAGDPDFWNAPFGAMRRAADLMPSPDPHRSALDFLATGMANTSATK